MTTLDKVIQTLAAQTGKEEKDFSGSTRLEDVAIDSLDYVDFMVTLRSEIKDVPEAVMMNAATLKDLAAVLE